MMHHFFPANHRADISCAIVAGGRSSRFGSDKALAPWKNQKTVIEAVLETASEVFKDVFVVGGKEKNYHCFGYDVYDDIIPGRGPLSGIHTALTIAANERIMIIACDMPAISATFLRYLCAIDTWAPVVAPESPSGTEPLHALWHASLVPIIENQLKKGAVGARHLLRHLPCRIVAMEEACRHGMHPFTLASVNTPEALERLRRLLHN